LLAAEGVLDAVRDEGTKLTNKDFAIKQAAAQGTSERQRVRTFHDASLLCVVEELLPQEDKRPVGS
jgi:hypothetical protein